VITSAGQTRVDVPRDRNGNFEPQIVPKRRRRLGSTTDMILSFYARGLTTRDIKAHLAEVYGIEVSHETVSKVTEMVVDEVRAWQARPVDEVYPIVFIDGLRIKVRDGGKRDQPGRAPGRRRRRRVQARAGDLDAVGGGREVLARRVHRTAQKRPARPADRVL
jgi:hypothetical protein